MRIVNRQEFLKLPSGIVYSNYQSLGMVEGLYEKGESLTNDWVYADLLGEIEAADADQFHEKFDEAEKGKEFELDMECGRRDGNFDESDMFMIYDKNDVKRLVAKLTTLMEAN